MIENVYFIQFATTIVLKLLQNEMSKKNKSCSVYP